MHFRENSTGNLVECAKGKIKKSKGKIKEQASF